MAPCLLGFGLGGVRLISSDPLGSRIYKFPAILDSQIRLDFVGLRVRGGVGVVLGGCELFVMSFRKRAYGFSRRNVGS